MIRWCRIMFLTVAVLCQLPPRALAQGLNLQSGVIRMEAEHFTIRLTDNYRYINAADTVRIMVDIWGNPRAQVLEQNPLGMIVDKNFVAEAGAAGIMITVSHDGHILDKDAHRLDDDALLQVIRKDSTNRNKEREAVGADPVTDLDWAVEPYYDRNAHKVYWAKNISFGKDRVRTLNYAVRALGRESTIHFNAISRMDRLNPIKRAMQNIMANSEFDPGFRYQDFNPRRHRLAEYGLVGLVAGRVKLKPGFIQNIWNALMGSSGMMLGSLAALAIMGRYMLRRRLPEF
jgi:uncharacterized membrane-anchored protein